MLYYLMWFSLLAALLYGLAFPAWEGVDLFPLAWVCLLPLLLPPMVALPFWRYSGIALLFGVLGSLIAGHWTLGHSLGFGTLAIVWHGLIVAPPLWLFRWVVGFAGYQRALWLLPFAWTGWEWLAANYQPFFWGALGATQANQTWLVQFADITGVWGVSFWLVALNAALAYLWGRRVVAGNRQSLTQSLSVVLLFLLPLILYGQWRVQTLMPQTTGTLRLTLLQPNAVEAEGFAALSAQMDTLDKTQTDLVIWPESIFNGMPFHDQDFEARIRRWDIPVMMVFIATQSNMRRPGFVDAYGAAIILDPTVLGRILKGPLLSLLEPHYRKQRLVPHEELQLVPDWAVWRWQWLQDQLPSRMLHADKSSPPLRFIGRNGVQHRFSPLICYEAVFPHLAAHAVRDGAEALFVLANDRHFGKTESWQAASFARLRAIETRRPLVRTSTSGVVGVIDALGKWQMRDNSRMAGAFPVLLTGVSAPLTWYVQWIDFLPKICLGVVLLLLSVVSLQKV
ncbi:MAG: apolipoprotein N-acyltransferase [Candidatus Thiothrix moscowensis]|nr:apolipoprotein N-acyltransferase [Candidatus Thiothrix moscowensis]